MIKSLCSQVTGFQGTSSDLGCPEGVSGAGVMFRRAPSDRQPECQFSLPAMPGPFYSYDRSPPGLQESNAARTGSMFDSASEFGVFTPVPLCDKLVRHASPCACANV